MFFVYLIIFISTGLAILLGSHFLVYLSMVYFFDMADPVHKTILLLALLFLSISPILATFLTMAKENYFTRGLYFLTGFWIGFFVNLFMAMIVAWIIVDLSWLLKLNTRAESIFLILTGAAFVYSLWGVKNARHPQIKQIEAVIPNLPDGWRGKKIVQLSDIHIGHVVRREFVDDVVGKVNLIDPEMVVITGDLFDGMDGDFDSPVRLINDINSKRGVFFITGNHETYLGVEQVRKDLEKTKAILLKDEVRDIDGLKLIGINYPDRNEKKNMISVLESLKKDFAGQPNILLSHSPVNIKQVAGMGINLELCGHTHYGQLFPFGYVAKLLFKGYAYGIHKINDYTLYVSSGTGSWGPPIRTGNTPEIVVITLR